MDYLIKHKHTHTHTDTRVLRLTVCERIPFFLLHSLTNQEKDHEQIFALLLHSDQILTV